MKKAIFFLVFLSLWNIVSAQKGPNMFPTKEAAEKAYEKMEFSYYTPKYFNHYKDNPVDGQKKIVKAIEKDGIAYMITADGLQWVILEKGTILRWEISVFKPYAHDKCGNFISFFFYLEKRSEKIDTITNSIIPKDSIPQIQVIVINGTNSANNYQQESYPEEIGYNNYPYSRSYYEVVPIMSWGWGNNNHRSYNNYNYNYNNSRPRTQKYRPQNNYRPKSNWSSTTGKSSGRKTSFSSNTKGSSKRTNWSSNTNRSSRRNNR